MDESLDIEPRRPSRFYGDSGWLTFTTMLVMLSGHVERFSISMLSPYGCHDLSRIPGPQKQQRLAVPCSAASPLLPLRFFFIPGDRLFVFSGGLNSRSTCLCEKRSGNGVRDMVSKSCALSRVLRRTKGEMRGEVIKSPV